MLEKLKSVVRSVDLDFVKNNVFGITDIKRGNRLYDAHMDEVMLARKQDQATIPLNVALKDEELDLDEILSMVNEFDEGTD